MLLYMDGFDARDAISRWTFSGAGWAATPYVTGRFSSGSRLKAGYTAGAMARQDTGEKSTLIAGCAFMYDADAAGAGFCIPIMSFWGDAGATQHVYIGFASTGKVQARRGNWTGTLLAESTLTLTHNSDYYVEAKVTLSDTVGVVTVKVNGVQWLTFSGDTKNGGTLTTLSSVIIGSQANFAWSANGHWDDVYICDTTDGTATQGAANSDFLGDCRVRTMFPSGAGSSTQLTPTGSANNWDNVNDIPPVTSTWNASGTVGHRDTYAMDNLGLTSSDDVIAIQHIIHVQRDNTTAIGMKAAVKSGATVAYGTTRALTTSVVVYKELMPKDPATTNLWTPSAIDAMEFGAEVA